eukprot:716263_1
MVIDDDVQARIDDQVVPCPRIMNEMDVEERTLFAGMRDSGETPRSEPDHSIESGKDDRSESFVDNERQLSNNDQNDSNPSSRGDGISSMGSSFQVSGLSGSSDGNDGNYGINRKSNMEYMKAKGAVVHELAMKQNITLRGNNSTSEYSRSQRDLNTKEEKSLGNISQGGLSRFSGLSGFSSVLRSAASFATSVTPGSVGSPEDAEVKL